MSEFIWTDNLVKEFDRFYNSPSSCVFPTIQDAIDKFKQQSLSKKDWEIYSFYFKQHIQKRIYEKVYGDNKMYVWQDEYICDVVSEPNVEQIEIKSVRRLSDGEVFSIDNITNQGRINWFHIIGNNKMFVYFEGNSRHCAVDDVVKVKQPLFTTVDGKDIYKSGGVIAVNSAWAKFNVDDMFQELYEDLKDHCKFFSTEESAKDYILMNKPCLSVNDIINANSWFLLEDEKQDYMTYLRESTLKDLVQSKLK